MTARSGLLKEESGVCSVEEDALQDRVCPCCNEQSSTNWLQVPERSQNGAGCYELLRCASCHHVWLDKPPAPDEMSYYYGPQYHRAVGSSGETSPKRWKRQLQVIQQYKSGGHILDVGCSSGGFLAYVKGRFVGTQRHRGKPTDSGESARNNRWKYSGGRRNGCCLSTWQHGCDYVFRCTGTPL